MSPRRDVHAIFDAALRSVDAGATVERSLSVRGHRILLDDRDAGTLGSDSRLIILAAGKAAMPMARAALHAAGSVTTSGVVVVPHGLAGPLPPLDVFGAGHPLPDAGSLAAAAESLRLARSAREGDLILCLLSGGASALWAAPPPGVTLGDVRYVADALSRAGAAIEELNTVRKQISRLAGGRLAYAAHPARVVTLAVSDVIGAPPEIIGSAPTVAGSTSYAEALEVLSRYGIEAPATVLRHLQRGAAGALGGSDASVADGAIFHLLADLDDALAAARADAERKGYRAEIISRGLSGEARTAGAEIASFAMRALRTGEGPRALLWGGETTVRVAGQGRGGRSQELALSAARALEGVDGITLLAGGTDGIDGPTPAAGAVVDGATIARGRKAGMNADDALARNDAYPFLYAAGDLLLTGPTGTNVGDLVIALVAG